MNTMNKTNKIWIEKNFIKYFLVTFVPLILIMISITLLIENNRVDKELVLIKSRENSGLANYSKHISTQFEMISADLMILSESNLLRKYIRKSSKQNRTNVEELFFSFSNRKKIYDQIRFFDLSGKEKIRINFNNGIPSIVPNHKLQNKGDRYYFKNSIALSKGNIFISQFDLNVENGKIEEPIKPMIRFGILVYDSDNNKQGVVVVNYLGERLLDNFLDLDSNSVSQTMLLNKEGFWLYNADKESEWGFMYKTKVHKNIQSKFEKEWIKISNNDNGQYQSEKGLFSFSTIFPLVELINLQKTTSENKTRDYYWKLISYYSDKELNNELSTSVNAIRIIQFLVSLLFFVGSIVQSRVMVLRKEAEEKKEEILKDLIKKEKLIENHNKFLNSILDSISSPFCVIDVKDYSIKMANSAYNSKGLQIGQSTCYEMSHNSDKPCHENGKDCLIKTLLKTKKGTVVEHTHFDDNENAIIHEVHGYPIFDDDGNVVEMIEYTFDITKRREAEEALKKSELQLQKMNADKDKFFAIISRDLKSPFQGIMGISELLKGFYDDLSDDEKVESIGLLNNSIKNVYSLILELLEWSMVQTGRMEYKPNKIDFENLVSNVISIASISAKEKKITIEKEVEENLIAFADSKMVETVIRNLLANAIKFTTENGVIALIAKREKDKVLIQVQDSGIGMNEEVIRKLFQIEEHHTTMGTAGEKGTGLGLILCKELVEKNNGKIWVESELGTGSIFSFTLPIEGENNVIQ